MKKTLSVILALLLVVLSTAPALAKPGNGNSGGKNPNLLLYGEMQGKHFKEKIKDSLKDKYKNYDQEEKDDNDRFNDTNYHWAAKSIKGMSFIGLFSGYPDGSFKPDQELTQAEALSLILRLVDIEDLDEDDDDEDIDEDEDEDEDIDEDDSELHDVPLWARHDAHKAAKKGVIKLNRFHSAVQASRAQVAVLLAKALELEPVDVSDTPFKDGIYLSAEDVGYIMALYEQGIMVGDANGCFNPNKAITRAQMAAILERLLDEDEDNDEDNDDDSDVASISLPKTAIVEQGESITLVATVKYYDGSGDEDIEWSSSDTDLATVDEDGVVTADDDETGTVYIKAEIDDGDDTISATCKVSVVEDIDAENGELEASDKTKYKDGKVYEEYELEVDGDKISLASDKVKSITLQQDNETPVSITPSSDSNLWFDVQSESGEYTLRVIQKDNDVYEATLDWTEPIEVDAEATGETRESSGNTYEEYELGDLDLTNFTCMYQIKPNDQVVKLGETDDENFWIKTTNQVDGTHTILVKQSGDWYTASITV